MRRILVDHAREKHRQKRGGSVRPISLDECMIAADEGSPDLLALNDALAAFEKIDPRKCRVVELRFFAGLTVEETAEALGIAPNTVLRDWSMAKAWLFREMSSGIASASESSGEDPEA